jgi:hypothetical protein
VIKIHLGEDTMNGLEDYNDELFWKYMKAMDDKKIPFDKTFKEYLLIKHLFLQGD